jgi:hypothetical protein
VTREAFRKPFPVITNTVPGEPLVGVKLVMDGVTRKGAKFV